MNDLLFGLIVGVGVGSVLSLPLVVWGDQIFIFLEEILATIKNSLHF